jgi:hypothetical protein
MSQAAEVNEASDSLKVNDNVMDMIDFQYMEFWTMCLGVVAVRPCASPAVLWSPMSSAVGWKGMC